MLDPKHTLKTDLPVGENLKDHMMLFVMTSLNTTQGTTKAKIESLRSKLQYQLFGTGIFASAAIESTGSFCTHDDAKTSKNCVADIQFSHFNLRDEVAHEFINQLPDRPGFSVVICLIDPKSVGTLKLKSSDPFVYPVIDPRYIEEKRDVDAYVRGIKLWERYITSPTLQSLGATLDHMNLKFCSQHKFCTDDHWQCVARHVANTIYHPVGTCKMGRKDDPSAVVDPELRRKGITNLRVADASSMHIITPGNTNAPVIMIAEKAADMIRGKDTVRQFKNRI